MEIGSFLELELAREREYYKGRQNIARLNSGRAAIWHAARCLGARRVWLPFYQCDTVRDFLRRKGMPVSFYAIDENFTPVGLAPKEGEAVLLVNYYGVMSAERLAALAAPYGRVILDCAQGFFTPQRESAGCMNIYSARKFVGVPDGAYVLGEGAERFLSEYAKDYSSDTAGFLLQRIEYGCAGKAYASRMENERRLDRADVLRMSGLTRALLDGADYDRVRDCRRRNFEIAHALFGKINRLDPTLYYDDTCVPMVYPFVYEDDGLLDRMQAAGHFQGHWWSYLLKEMPADSFEYRLSRYIIPITIDQRYGEAELRFLWGLVK